MREKEQLSEEAKLKNIKLPMTGVNTLDFSSLKINSKDPEASNLTREFLKQLKAQAESVEASQDEFNKTAALVPESDPELAEINKKLSDK